MLQIIQANGVSITHWVGPDVLAGGCVVVPTGLDIAPLKQTRANKLDPRTRNNPESGLILSMDVVRTSKNMMVANI